MAIQGFFTGDVKIRDLNGVLKAVDGIVEVATDAGTVTSVGLTVGSTGTDVNVANSPITTSGSITLNLPTASATNRGLLSSADWAIFSAKQGAITLTTTGNNGSATLISGTLNIPTYTLAGLGGISLTSLSASSPLLYNNTTGAFSIQVANGSQDGYLSSADWTTFNSKQSALTFSSPLVNTAGTVSIPAATSSVNGYLTSTDWVTFNAKQGAITLTTTGSSGAATLIGATLNIPNYSGALTGYVPYTGATGAVNLGAYDLTVQTLTIGKGNSGLANNTALGYRTLFHITTGNYNTAVGYEAAHNTTTGQYNTALGQSALFTNTTGSQNTALGLNALLNNTTGGSNVVVGLDALQHNTTGSSNTALGYNAGSHITGGSTPNTTASNSVYIGRDSKAKVDGGSNEIVIGYNAIGNGSNTATFGNTSTTANYFTGSINGGSFVKSGGTSSQFLKADGSVDSSTYYLASNPSAFIALTALSATAPLSYSNTTGVFSISQATTSTDGYLSSTDWNTFYNKQAAGSYITALTGEATATGPGSATVTLSTSAVTGKLLTGLNLTGGGSIAATDSILQAFGKVQNQISGLAGGVTYQGTWNASTNTPTLTSSVGTKGYYYIVDVAGSTNLNGITDWKIGDWAIFNGSTWDKVDNTDAVSSVNGFTGAVSLTTSNIAEGTNLYYLDSRARLALSFTAGSGAYNNTTGVITIPTNTSQLTNGANFITLSSLSASSPLSYNSGTGAFSIQVANSFQNGYLSSTDWNTFNSKQNTITLTTTGSSGSSTLVGATLNVPTYTLSGLGGVPTSRQLTINGTAYDLSADRSWSVGTVTGSGTTGYVSKWSSSTAISNSLLYDNGSAVLIGTQTASTAKFMVYSSAGDNHYQAIGTAPSFRFADTITSPTYTGVIGLATGSNQFVTGSAAGDMVLSSNTSSAGNFLFGTAATERMRINATTGNVSIGGTGNTYKLDVTGTGRFSGQLRLESTITDGTNTYTLPSATGTLALTSAIPSNPVGGTGTTNYLPKFTGASTIGNSLVYDDGTNVGIGTTSPNTLLSLVGNHAGGQSILKIQSSTAYSSSGLSSIGFNDSDGSRKALVYTNTNGLQLETSTATPILFNTNGNERLRIDASGNVGIGTTSPANRLHLVGASATPSLRLGSTSLAYYWDIGRENATTGDFVFNNANDSSSSEKMRITVGGNVGIGTTSPVDYTNYRSLHIMGATSTSSAILYLTNSTSSVRGLFFAEGTANRVTIGSQSNHDFTFLTNDAERMRITSGGNVGIGVTNPQSQLHLNGTITFTESGFNTVRLNQIQSSHSDGSSPNNNIRFLVSNGSGTTAERMRINGDGNLLLQSGVTVYNDSGAFFLRAGTSGDLILGAGGTNGYMRITSGGNVGIGTTSPNDYSIGSTAKVLQVTGSSYGIINANAGSVYAWLIADTTAAATGTFSNHDFKIVTNNTERMRITSGGNVLIGTTTGDGYKLQIVGNSQASSTFGQTYSTVAAYSQWVNSSGAFVMGLDGAAGTTERMRIKSSGSVVISSAQNDSGGRRFYAYDGGTGNQNGLGLDMAGNAYEYSLFFAYGTSDNGRTTIGSYDGTTYRAKMTVLGNGNVLINTTTDSGNKLEVNGTARFGSVVVGSLSTGTVYSNGGTLTNTNPSDYRLKNTIKPLTYGLNEVLQLNPKSFYYNDNATNLKYGFIAQEVKEVMPELARKLDENSDYLGLETEGIFVTLVNAVKELKAELDLIKNK